MSAAPHTIKRDNLVEWLLWAIFGVHKSDMKEEWVEEIEGYLNKMQSVLGTKIEEGWDKTVRCMKVTLDPVDAIHRPLIWYLVSLFLLVT